jgi:hypothetical protein
MFLTFCTRAIHALAYFVGHAVHVQKYSGYFCRTVRVLIPTLIRLNKKGPANCAGPFLFNWRRERDSNPR